MTEEAEEDMLCVCRGIIDVIELVLSRHPNLSVRGGLTVPVRMEKLGESGKSAS